MTTPKPERCRHKDWRWIPGTVEYACRWCLNCGALGKRGMEFQAKWKWTKPRVKA